MLKKWQKLSESIFAVNKYWTYKIDSFLIDGKLNGEYHYVHTLGSSMVIPINSDGKILLTKQYRYLNDLESFEFPCGGLENGLSFEQNAIKELREDTGFSCHTLKYIGFFAPYSGVSDEICKVYIAKDLFHSPLNHDLTEEFENQFFTIYEIDEMIKNNTIWDGMTLAAWLLAKNTIGLLDV